MPAPERPNGEARIDVPQILFWIAVVVGVAAAALLLGLAQEFGSGYIDPAYTSAYPMIVMLAVIALRPSGLFKGSSGRRL